MPCTSSVGISRMPTRSPRPRRRGFLATSWLRPSPLPHRRGPQGASRCGLRASGPASHGPPPTDCTHTRQVFYQRSTQRRAQWTRRCARGSRLLRAITMPFPMPLQCLLRFVRPGIAVRWPCLCHAGALPLPCCCHALAMPLPCLCHASAMPVPCLCRACFHGFSMQWPCRCRVFAMYVSCRCLALYYSVLLHRLYSPFAT